MPGVRRIARCANGHSAFEWVSDAQMDARPRNLVPRPARRNLAFPTWRDESCQTEDSLTNMSFFWSRKTIFWHKFAVVNDSASSVDFRKTHNPRSQNFQDAESPSWGIHYRSQPQICARKRKIGTKRALSAANGDWVRWRAHCFGKACCAENGAIMSDD